MMETYIAQAIGTKIPELNIVGTKPFPEFSTLEECARQHRKEGKAIASALWKSLPGGTIDALICEMMKRRASMFVVPFYDKTED